MSDCQQNSTNARKISTVVPVVAVSSVVLLFIMSLRFFDETVQRRQEQNRMLEHLHDKKFHFKKKFRWFNLETKLTLAIQTNQLTLFERTRQFFSNPLQPLEKEEELTSYLCSDKRTYGRL